MTDHKIEYEEVLDEGPGDGLVVAEDIKKNNIILLAILLIFGYFSNRVLSKGPNPVVPLLGGRTKRKRRR